MPPFLRAQHFPAHYCGDLNSNISGSIRIGGGEVQEGRHKISGSGNIDCRSVESRNTHGEISGSGTIRVWATDTSMPASPAAAISTTMAIPA